MPCELLLTRLWRLVPSSMPLLHLKIKGPNAFYLFRSQQKVFSRILTRKLLHFLTLSCSLSPSLFVTLLSISPSLMLSLSFSRSLTFSLASLPLSLILSVSLFPILLNFYFSCFTLSSSSLSPPFRLSLSHFPLSNFFLTFLPLSRSRSRPSSSLSLPPSLSLSRTYTDRQR